MEQVKEYYTAELTKANERRLADRLDALAKATADGRAVTDHLTTARRRRLENGTLTLEQAKAIAEQEIREELADDLAGDLANMESILGADKRNITTIAWVLTYRRSRMYGWQPTANVQVTFDDGRTADYVGKAGGCGYDLNSAAVANALNQCIEFKCLLAVAKFVNRNKRNPCDMHCGSNEIFLAYGCGYGVLPYLEGGVGLSCFDNVLRNVLSFDETSSMCTDDVRMSVYTAKKA